MIYDIFSYNGEADMLEIRLNILNDSVDQFIIIEAPTTFSGLDRFVYFPLEQERFKKFLPKIRHFIIDETYTPEEIYLAESSPNTKGAAHWKHEFLQKESIKKALTHLQDDDICFIGDVDEIWLTKLKIDEPTKLKLKVYCYYLDNRSSEEFWGTLVSPYKYIKNTCLNHLRSNNGIGTTQTFGFHFTSMGGYEVVKEKLINSYTRESYWTPKVEKNLKANIENRKDFLGRPFIYTKDESDWPQWLKENKAKYQHLCLP